MPCWTRKCVSVSGLEVSSVHKFRSHLSGGGNLHGHVFPCETQKRVTMLDMVVHSITCHQIGDGGRPCRELSPCRCQAAAAAIHAAAKQPPTLHCHATATAAKMLQPPSCCRPAAANDTTTVPSWCHSTSLTSRSWQHNCSASTPPPHSHSRGNQTSLCTSVLAVAAAAIARASKGQVMIPRHHCSPCRRRHCATLFARRPPVE